MRARWSPTGSSSHGAAFPASPGSRPPRRRASSPGCSIPRSCCKAPNSRSTAPSCSRSPCRSAICARWRRKCRTARRGCAPASRWPSPRCRCRPRRRRSAPRPATWPRSSSGRSCRTAAISRATRWRCSSCWPISCRCATPMPTRPKTPPDALIGAIDRMLPALRFFRHQDGSLARFNGMGATIHDRIAAILRHDDTAGAPLLHAPHSGYERLSIGGTTVIADTGPAPPAEVSQDARMPAACRSRLSSGRHHYIVNCGRRRLGAGRFPAAGPRHRRAFDRHAQRHLVGALQPLGRASTALLGSPLVGGPQHGAAASASTPRTAQGFVASHDGYVAALRPLSRARAVTVARAAIVLTGIDRFFRAGGEAAAQQWPRLRRRALPHSSRHQPVHRDERGPAGACRRRRRHLGFTCDRG